MGLGPGVRPSGPKAVPSTILCPLPDSPMNVRSSTHLMRAFMKATTITTRAQPTAERDRRRGGDQQFLRYASLKARLPRTRHRHGDLKWKASSTAHRQPADGRDPPASRLDCTARTPLLLKRINSPSLTRVSV